MLIRIENYSLKDITDGIELLLDRAAHAPEVRQLAVSIIYERQDRIAAIYDWVKANVSYVPDPVQAGGEIELFISPVKMVKDFGNGVAIAGDCDDMALLTTALYRSIGIKANVVLLDTGGSGLDHAVCEVETEELGMITVDPSAEYPLGWEEKYFSKVVVP